MLDHGMPVVGANNRDRQCLYEFQPRKRAELSHRREPKQSKLDRTTMRFFCWHSLGVPPGPKQKRGSSVDTTGSFLLIELDHVEVPNKI